MKSLSLLGLGSKHWNMKATLNALPDEVAIQVFDNWPGGFGDPRPHLKRLCATGKVKVVEIQLWYQKSHSLCPLDFMDERLPLWRNFANQFPSIYFCISHTTEHREQNKAKLNERMNLIVNHDHDFIPVNNPDRKSSVKGVILPGEINETHSPNKLPGNYLASMDGFDTTGKGNVLGWNREHKSALYNFAWSGLCNLNDGRKGSDSNTPPAKRTAAPGRKHLEMLLHISEAPPAPLRTGIPFPNKWLWKPVRETTYNADGSPDSRNNKPCLITKKKVAKYDLFTYNGIRIGSLPYYGPYYNKADPSKNGFRYYSGSPGGINLWGYEIARKAMKISGSPWVYLEGNIGVEPSFRFGYFT